MYERDGEKYFVVDRHLHFWDASPGNWIKGQEEYAKGWIECFHAYMGLGPPETHWPIEKFQKYSEEDFVRDVVQRRLQHGGEERDPGREVPGAADPQRSLGSP